MKPEYYSGVYLLKKVQKMANRVLVHISLETNFGTDLKNYTYKTLGNRYFKALSL